MRQLTIVLGIFGVCVAAIAGQVADTSQAVPPPPQYDLSADGRTFLIDEAAKASLFMLGELHGENEIPALIGEMWPSMWAAGYRQIAAEISPWAADRLELGNGEIPIIGLWTEPEAKFVSSMKTRDVAVLWGCDIEEGQPQFLVRELAAANPGNSSLQTAADMVKGGYQRRMAPALLPLVKAAGTVKDPEIGDVSLRTLLIQTLEVEADRSAGAALSASLRREEVMKTAFYAYWVKSGRAKTFLRFGRNHLHRGVDRRGVSTLGNFATEVAGAEHLPVFNVAAFAGGGKIRLGGPATDFDERGDDPAFAYLASLAKYPATVFDLRPLKTALHRLPESRRSATESSLMYWADSYDAIIFYRVVTPLNLG